MEKLNHKINQIEYELSLIEVNEKDQLTSVNVRLSELKELISLVNNNFKSYEYWLNRYDNNQMTTQKQSFKQLKNSL